VRSKSGSAIFLRRNPAGSFTVLIRESTSVFSATATDATDAVADVFSSGASVSSSSGSGILRTTSESKAAIYVSAQTKRKVSAILHLLGNDNTRLTALVDNMLH